MTKTWTTRDGKKMRVDAMSDSHLLNAIKCMERNAKRYYDEVTSDYPCFQGEMAQDYAEAQWDAVASGGWEGLLPEAYYWLEEERNKRGLKHD